LAKFASAQQSWKEQTGTVMSVEISKVFVGKTNVRKSPGDVGDLVDSIKRRGFWNPFLRGR
jgi:ParB-like chromosome segregation protein Spo0J